MKASKLVRLLNESIKKYGDKDVISYEEYYEALYEEVVERFVNIEEVIYDECMDSFVLETL